MSEATREANRLATVFGGSGFLGRYIVRALVHEDGGSGSPCGDRSRRFSAADRRRGTNPAGQANLRFPDSIAAALEGATAVVNATGVKAESGAQTFHGRACRGRLGAGASRFGRGRRDLCAHFGNRRGPELRLALYCEQGAGREGDARDIPRRGRHAPVGRVRPGGRLLQPLRRAGVPSAGFAPVGGRRDSLAAGLCRRRRTGGRRGALRLGESRRDLRTRRSEDDDPAGSGRADAAARSIAVDRSSACRSVPRVGSQRRPISPPKATFGLFPKLLTTTRDQVDLLASENVVSAEAEAEGRVLSALGVRRNPPRRSSHPIWCGSGRPASMRFSVQIERSASSLRRGKWPTRWSENIAGLLLMPAPDFRA